MKIFINSKQVKDEAFGVSISYKDFNISYLNSTKDRQSEIVIFPEEGRVIDRSIPLLSTPYYDIGDAVHAIDKLTDAIALGLIEYDYTESGE